MLKRLASLCRAGWQLSTEEKGLAVCLLFYSAAIRCTLSLLPFRLWKALLGDPSPEATVPLPASDAQVHKARQLAILVKKVALHTPWQSQCLAQAMMTRSLLRCYRIPCMVCLGAKIQPSPVGALKAHAWVNVGTHIVIGGHGHRAYPVVATFICTASAP